MYRRRLRREPIAFSFDSFLDVVANVIGIIVRLILVAWVGARSYTAIMQIPEDTSPSPTVEALPAPTVADDPVSPELERIRRELAEARRRLLNQLEHLHLTDRDTHVTEAELAALTRQRAELEAQGSRLSLELAGKNAKVKQTVASAAELKRRGDEVLKKIKALQQGPSQKQVLRYHTPVSRVVHTDEVFFECRNGRVTYIDLPAFMQEIRNTLEDRVGLLKTQWQVTAVTAPAGPFRLRYVVEREKSALEGIGGTPIGGGFRYGLSEWVLEPLTAQRGEPLETALTPNSAFRRLVDRIDPQITVVTFWVYPDSFELFRRIRDFLYDRDVEVAGRPLTDDAHIAASRQGTASRGQ
jgi:hypothetical protein